ncbi:MAG: apolipoprotein N-acyltransferase [Acidobacteriota bacterium]
MGHRGLQLIERLLAESPDGQPSPGWVSPLLAVVGGVGWGLCFGIEPREGWAFFALAPLVVLLPRRRGVLWAWVFSWVSWLVAMPWIATTLETFGALPRALAVVLGALLAAYLALDIVLFAWLARRVMRRSGRLDGGASGWAAWGALPALWVAVESLRGLIFGGFPWNLAAYVWTDLPGALELSAWIGAEGVSGLLVLTNAALALGFLQRRLLAAAIVWASVGALLAAGFLASPPGEIAPPGESGGQQVRVIQPNSGIITATEAAWESYYRLIEMSRRACDQPALLIWPESAAWPFSWDSTPQLRRDAAELNARGCPVLMGSALKRPEGWLNAAYVVDENGPGEPYAKRRLVPFGEYVPFGDLLPFVESLARNAGNFAPGSRPGLIPWGDQSLAMAICYEVIFGPPVAEQVRAGSTALVTVTNDAWYGDSSAPHQHLRAARFRAAENRRPMLRAALTGISAVIDSRGGVQDSLAIGEMGVLEARLAEGAAELTLYSRLPHAPRLLAVLLSALALAMSWNQKSGEERGGNKKPRGS